MNLSPFTKGSRVLRAFNVILSIFVRITPLTYLQNHHIESVWTRDSFQLGVRNSYRRMKPKSERQHLTVAKFC